MRRLLLPALAASLAFAALLSLGFWQLERLAWKEALIARVAAGLAAQPIPAPPPAEWADVERRDLEYQPVTVTGRFLHHHEIHVFTTLNAPRGRHGGMGYMVMTPLQTAEGWYVYVNRGFVPEANKVAATRAAGQSGGVVTVVGLYRAPAATSWFSPGDDPSKNVWFARDPDRFALHGGLPLHAVAPYIVDSRFDPAVRGGLPQGGETLIQFPNNHLGYAVTWFGLAAALAGVFGVFAWRRLRG